MDNIVALNGKASIGHETVPLADELEDIARKIRSGEISAVRGIFAYQTHKGTIAGMAVGDAMNKLEACGILDWAKGLYNNG